MAYHDKGKKKGFRGGGGESIGFSERYTYGTSFTVTLNIYTHTHTYIYMSIYLHIYTYICGDSGISFFRSLIDPQDDPDSLFVSPSGGPHMLYGPAKLNR